MLQKRDSCLSRSVFIITALIRAMRSVASQFRTLEFEENQDGRQM